MGDKVFKDTRAMDDLDEDRIRCAAWSFRDLQEVCMNANAKQ